MEETDHKSSFHGLIIMNVFRGWRSVFHSNARKVDVRKSCYVSCLEAVEESSSTKLDLISTTVHVKGVPDVCVFCITSL